MNNRHRAIFELTPTLSELEILKIVTLIIKNWLFSKLFAKILHNLNLTEEFFARIRNNDFFNNHK